MNQDELRRICDEVIARVNLAQGQSELKKISDRVKTERIEREKAGRINIEDLHRPFTI